MMTPSQIVWEASGSPSVERCEVAIGRCYVCCGDMKRGVLVSDWLGGNYTDQNRARWPSATHVCEACVFVHARSSPVPGRPCSGARLCGNSAPDASRAVDPEPGWSGAVPGRRNPVSEADQAGNEARSRDESGASAQDLWKLASERPGARVPWFDTFCPRRIRAVPALILVEVVAAARALVDVQGDTFKEELRKLGRGVAHMAWESGLQRPVVLAIVEPDASHRATLKKLAAEQEWHRGEFTLWPLKTESDLDWLLEPNVEALEQRRDDRARRIGDAMRVTELAASLTRAGSPHLGALIQDRFADIAQWREDEHDATPLGQEERNAIEPAIERWIADELQRRMQESPQEAAAEDTTAPAVALRVPLVAWSYAPAEPGELHFPADAPEIEREDWPGRYRADLLRLRSQVLRQASPELEVDLKCTPAVAMYLGSVFHAATGVALVSRQRNQRTQADELWRATAERTVDRYPLESQLRSLGDEPSELQVRVSVAQDVTGDADAWTSEQGLSARVLDLSVRDLGAGAIENGNQAFALAVAVREAIVTERRSWSRVARARDTGARRPLPLRIFYAGPVTGALFVGAQLNALGECLLMDYLNDVRRYVVSFRLSPGN